MLGAVYMATDMVTVPVTNAGRWIFGVGVGLLVVIIRVWGGLPEGVMYAILSPGTSCERVSLPGYRICTTPGITAGNRWNTSGS